MAKETFGQRISRLRKEKNYTQNDIADKVGVTAQAVSKWENDQATPDIDVLVKLSDIYDISLDDLLGKEKQTTSLLPEKPSKKDIDNMTLKIKVLSGDDGDTVNVNLPLALVRVFVNQDDGKIGLLEGNPKLENIDFRKIIELVEAGVIGELITVDSKDGDKVRVVVE